MLAGVFLRENAVKPDCKRGMFHHRPGWRGFAILVFLIRLIPLYFLSCTEIRGRMLHAFQILVAFLWHRSRGHARYSFPSSPASAPVSVPADRVLQSHVILLSFYEVVVSNHTRVFSEERCKTLCNAGLHQREQQTTSAAGRKCSYKCFRE